jgi:serine/threonine protein kinase/tetratricopeptide (TPR) repeat protein
MSYDDEASKHPTERLSKEELTRRHRPGSEGGAAAGGGELAAGDTVGLYRIRRRIGRGGMGEVYEAEQLEPVRRTVALKVIRWGLDSDEVVARFASERQALALMDHPNIARVLDAGATDRGRPYFVMEYVRGVPLNEYCDTQRLDMRRRLELFTTVCEAVQHAHQKGIIHRDLKPANVLVETHGDHAVPKIIDFGVAKATAQKLTEHSVFTEFGQIVGTPEFMSPEQAEMSGHDIDTRTDVYALGVMLYWMLTGALPFEPEELRAGGFDEIRRTIREVDPPRPSTRFSSLGGEAATIARKRGVDAATLARRLRGDLDWIVMKALEKDRTRRYGSASEMSADVERHLRDEPVLARPPSAAYRMRKFVARHRAMVGAGTALLVLLVAFSIAMSVQSVRLARERDRARAEADKALAFQEFIERTLLAADPATGLGVETTIVEALEMAAVDQEESLAGQPEVQAAVRYALGSAYFKLARYEEAAPLLRLALQARRELPGIDPLDVADSAVRVGELESVEGNYEAAEALLLEAAATRREVLGDSPDTAYALERVAMLYRDLGRYEEAAEAITEAVAVRRATGGDAELAGALAIQGNIAYATGDNDTAETLFRESLALRRARLGDYHVAVAENITNLAVVLEAKGDVEAAEAMYRQAIDVMRELYGGNTPELAAITGNLAMLIDQQGDDDAEAERLYRDALSIDTELLGADNVNISIDLVNLGSFLVTRQRYAEAEPLLLRALQILEGALGPDAWITANARSLYGAVLTGLQRHGEAEEQLLAAAAVLEAELGAEHERTRRAWERLVTLYEASGRPANAAAFRERLGG